MTLFEKIQQALTHDEVCILSQQGKHLYAVVPWERYQKLIQTHPEEVSIETIPSEARVIHEANIDINEIPV